jgi:iron complex outermembrane receptor protein
MSNSIKDLFASSGRLSARRKLAGSTAILLASMVLTPALAQPETEKKDDGPVEEILVIAPDYVSTGSRSATKTDAPLIETPQSVTVISRDQIELLGWNSLQQSVRYTAGVTGENYGPDERYDWLTLRGFYPIQYIDGLQAPIGSVTNVGTDLYGFESVDILKGPSSVLYGQTPPGGIVNMTSRRPQREFGGEVGVQYGSYEHIQVNGDITGALSDRFAARLTGMFRDRENQVDFMESERVYVAPAVTLDITDRTTITLLGYYQKDDVDNYSGGFLPAYGTLLPNPNGKIPVGFSAYEPGLNFFEREQWAIGYDFQHEFNASLAFQQNLKYFDVKSSQGGTYGQGFVDADFDGEPDDYRTIHRSIFPFDEDISSFNVDNRLSASVNTGELEHNILLGFDYRRYKIESFFGFDFSEAFGGNVPTLDIFDPVYGIPFPAPEATIGYQDVVQKQYGIYLQDQISIDRLVVTLSGRYDMVDTDNFGTKLDDNKFSYRAGLNYVFDNGFAPYIQTAKSFQPVTGYDERTQDFFVPTTGTQYEAGIKYDGRNLGPDYKFFASLAAYTLKQKNVPSSFPTLENPFGQTQAGEVKVQGIEFEAIGRFFERLSINFSYTYTDTEVTENTDPTLIGNRLTVVPKHKISGLIDYTFVDGPLAGLGAGIGVRYLSAVYGDQANQWRTPGVTLFDAAIHYDTPGWKFLLNASNLFDKTYVARCSSTIDCFYGTKQVITGSITRKF